MIELLYIDLFCGAGGTSTGVENARYKGNKCAHVIACVNHDKNAITSHAANHPDALHFTEDIRTLDITDLVKHVDEMRIKYPAARVVLWISAECTSHSNAKGGTSRDADSRSLPEHLYRYIQGIRPDEIQVENVKEFMDWGPLMIKVVKDKHTGQELYCPIDIKKHRKIRPVYVPDPRYKGEYFKKWVETIKGYGYAYDHRLLNAADFGAYTCRIRYFGIFSKDIKHIAFPKATHSKKNPSLKKWKAVKDVLNLDQDGVSIFGRKKPLSENTLKRIYAGLIKFVAGGQDAFMIKWNSMQTSGKYNCPGIDEPCPTVTCQNRLGLTSVKFLSKYYSGHPESKNVGLDGPAHTIKCKDNHSLVTARFLSTYYGNGSNMDISDPAPTLTVKDRVSFVNAKFFIDQQYGQSKPASIDNPVGALTVNPKYNIVRAKWIMNGNFNNTGSAICDPAPVICASRRHHYLMNPQYNSAGGNINDPSFTLIARMDKMPPYLVATIEGESWILVYPEDSPMTIKIKQFMSVYGIVDITMRMLMISELKRIMGFPSNYKLIGTQTEQKKYIGNAVEVNMARVLCEALLNKLNQ